MEKDEIKIEKWINEVEDKDIAKLSAEQKKFIGFEIRKEMEEVEEKRIEEDKKKRRRWLTTIIILIIIIIIIIFYWHINLPSQGVLTNVCKPSIQKEEPGLKEYSCDRFSFKYLGIYSIKTEETNFDNVIRRVNFRTDEKLKKRMIVKVSNEGKKKVDEIPSVSIRREKKNNYVESSIEVDGRKGLYFEKSGKENERTMFFYDGDVLVAVSLYSDFEISNDRDFEVVTETFDWHN